MAPDGGGEGWTMRQGFRDFATKAMAMMSGVGCVAAVLGLLAGPAQAVPSFAVQTGQPCQACHVGGFGPQLTAFGRSFKMHGYTQRGGSSDNLPISAMAVASWRVAAGACPLQEWARAGSPAWRMARLADELGLKLRIPALKTFAGFHRRAAH